jgi:hypothetical protein
MKMSWRLIWQYIFPVLYFISIWDPHLEGWLDNQSDSSNDKQQENNKQEKIHSACLDLEINMEPGYKDYGCEGIRCLLSKVELTAELKARLLTYCVVVGKVNRAGKKGHPKASWVQHESKDLLAILRKENEE